MNGMVVGLKNNCSSLLAFAEQAFGAKTASLDVLDQTDKRQIRRETAVLTVDPTTLPKPWRNSITCFIRVKRSGIRYNSSKKSKKEKKRKERKAKALKGIANTSTQPTSTEVANEEILVVAPVDSPIKPPIRFIPMLNKKREPIDKERSKNAVYFEETVYYAITKRDLSAKLGAAVCQGHWRLEGFHRYKDVNFNEDKNRIKNTNVASALSQVFNYTLNTLVLTGQKSVKIATETLSNNINALFELVATTKNYNTV